MVREPGGNVRERPYRDVLRGIEERIEERHGQLFGEVPRRIQELPKVRVDRNAQQLAEELAAALNRGVKALDRW